MAKSCGKNGEEMTTRRSPSNAGGSRSRFNGGLPVWEKLTKFSTPAAGEAVARAISFTGNESNRSEAATNVAKAVLNFMRAKLDKPIGRAIKIKCG